MKKFILFSFALCFVLMTQAQTSKTVNSVAGDLRNRVTTDEIGSVTHLVVTGTLNQSDFSVFYDMTNLLELDLTDSKIEAYSTTHPTTGVVTKYPENGVPSIGWTRHGITTIKLPSTAKSIVGSMGGRSLTSIVIPNTVDSIGEGAFNGCWALSSVKLPDAVRSIGDNAFNSCRALTSITLPSSLKSIGNNAFQNCYGLTSIEIPAGVDSLGRSVFQNCTTLVSAVIPEKITKLPSNLFYGCKVLNHVEIKGNITSIGERAFYACAQLASFPFGSSLETMESTAFSDSGINSVDLSATKLTTLSNASFYNCKSLVSVNLHTSAEGGLTTIGTEVFRGCTTLTGDVVIPSTVTSIGGNMFTNTKIISATLPEGLETIPTSFFNNCSSLKSVVIPESVYSISNDVFSGCSSLESIVLPEGLATIGSSAFANCSALQKIDLPRELLTIVNGAFEGCTSLKSITIPAGITSIGASVFYNCSALESIQLSENITSIGNSAFLNCSALKSINLPKDVASIGVSAFSGCTSLQSITVNNLEPVDLTNVADVFKDVPTSTCKLYVMNESIPAYKNAAKWADFANNTQAIVVKQSQSIGSFIDIEAKTGDTPITLGATATSGLDVSYSIESGKEGVATLNGNILTIVGTGIAKITVSQQGNENFEAATPVEVTLTVTAGSSIGETEGALAFALVENPVKDEAQFSFESAGNGARIVISDLTGKIVAQQAVVLGATEASISVSNLSSGVYLARYVDNSGKVSTIKFIK